MPPNCQRSRALSPRIVPCPLSGDRSAQSGAISSALEGGAELVVDHLAHTPTPDATLAAFDSLKVGGTLVLVGGIRHELPLSYETLMRRQLTVRGSFMFDRNTVMDVWRMMQTGALDLSVLRPHPFTLDDIESAMDAAKEPAGFSYAVLLPNG